MTVPEECSPEVGVALILSLADEGSEMGHVYGDKILVAVLRWGGYHEVADAYEAIEGKRYA